MLFCTKSDDQLFMCKVGKRRHQYPEFGHTQGEIKKNLQKGELPLKGGGETQKTINFDGS